MIRELLKRKPQMDHTRPLSFCMMVGAIGHEPQDDKGGVAYYMHSINVMLGVGKTDDPDTDLIAQCVGILHDVVEDTRITIKDLEMMNVPECILAPLRLLTHKRGMSYKDYIILIKTCHIATRVKLADLRTNSDIMRLRGIGEKDSARIIKYHAAHMYLEGRNDDYTNS